LNKLTLALFMLLFLVLASYAQIIEKVDFDDAPVLEVLEILSQQAGLDIVISGDNNLVQNKRTSIHLENIPAVEAIDHVLQTNGLSSVKQDGVLLIALSPAPSHNHVFQGRAVAIDLKYLSASRVEQLLNKVFPSIKTSPGGSKGSIVLQGKVEALNEAKELIKQIDQPIPQILIESEVLELAESDSVRLGFSHVNQPGVFVVDDLGQSLRALISQGQAQVIARPRIATLDGHEALINIGSRVPYAVPVSNGSTDTQWTVEYIDAGVKLRITPRLGEAGHVTAEIQPEVSSISQWRSTSAGDFPVISTRNAQATVRVKNGETIVVGGLLSETDRVNVSRIPIIGQIPILNFFFQDRTVEKIKTEIVFLITPHVI